LRKKRTREERLFGTNLKTEKVGATLERLRNQNFGSEEGFARMHRCFATCFASLQKSSFEKGKNSQENLSPDGFQSFPEPAFSFSSLQRFLQ
jgi:hypothetical protein